MGDRELRRRPADQDGDGVLVLGAGDAGVDRLGLGGEEQRLGGDDVGAGRGSRRILVLGDVERALVLRHRVGQEVVQGIRLPELEIGGGERGLLASTASRWEGCGAGLGAGANRPRSSAGPRPRVVEGSARIGFGGEQGPGWRSATAPG